MRATSPQLYTARLLLRPLCIGDFEPWAQMMSDDEAARFIGGRQVRAVAWRGFMTMAGAWDLQGFAMFSVIERATGRWVGRLGPWQPDGWPGPEIGWAIVRDCWGRGYATEGAAAAMDWVFDVLGWQQVIHTIAPDNIASQVVARKLGSSNLGPGTLPAPFEGMRVDIWGQSRAQWQQRQSVQARASAANGGSSP
jgi:RimJ/RimL family protein N-acetyltransferase